MEEITELIKRVEVEINKTPTGELRNLLCDVNIVLHLLEIKKRLLLLGESINEIKTKQ